MKQIFFAITMLLLVASWHTVYAAPTANVLGGGVAINEILIDPNSGTNNSDTDSNGTAVDLDEFVELYNVSAGAIDISGWELWDAGNDDWFTFPGAADSGTTMLPAGAYAVVVVGVQGGGSLPTMSNPNSLVFNAARGAAVINNGGDNVVLYDPGTDEYIQLIYNGDAADDPPNDYTGFSATAALVGSAEDWGNDGDGVSLTRSPSGDTNVIQHNATFGSTASPTAVSLSHQAAETQSSFMQLPTLVAITLMAVTITFFWRRPRVIVS